MASTQTQPCHKEAIAPGLRRLSNQLRVDFATDIRSTDEKRKRKPTYSVYKEAAEDARERAFRRRMKESVGRKRPKYSIAPQYKAFKSQDPDHPHTADSLNDQGVLKMMSAAVSLAQLSAGKTISNPLFRNTSHRLEEKEFDAIAKAYAETIAAKDEAINIATAALATKEELIRVQAMLISIMQQHTPAFSG